MIIEPVRSSVLTWCWFLALAGCQDGAEETAIDARPCTAVGCGPVTQLSLPYVGNDADLIESVGRVCLNDLCVEATLHGAVPTCDGCGTGASFEGSFTRGDLSLSRKSGALFVEAQTYEHMMFPLTIGDVYTLTHRAQDGRELLQGRWIAREYVTSYPNGVECGPACLRARLEMSSP